MAKRDIKKLNSYIKGNTTIKGEFLVSFEDERSCFVPEERVLSDTDLGYGNGTDVFITESIPTCDCYVPAPDFIQILPVIGGVVTIPEEFKTTNKVFNNTINDFSLRNRWGLYRNTNKNGYPIIYGELSEKFKFDIPSTYAFDKSDYYNEFSDPTLDDIKNQGFVYFISQCTCIPIPPLNDAVCECLNPDSQYILSLNIVNSSVTIPTSAKNTVLTKSNIEGKGARSVWGLYIGASIMDTPLISGSLNSITELFSGIPSVYNFDSSQYYSEVYLNYFKNLNNIYFIASCACNCTSDTNADEIKTYTLTTTLSTQVYQIVEKFGKNNIAPNVSCYALTSRSITPIPPCIASNMSWLIREAADNTWYLGGKYNTGSNALESLPNNYSPFSSFEYPGYMELGLICDNLYINAGTSYDQLQLLKYYIDLKEGVNYLPLKKWVLQNGIVIGGTNSLTAFLNVSYTTDIPIFTDDLQKGFSCSVENDDNYFPTASAYSLAYCNSYVAPNELELETTIELRDGFFFTENFEFIYSPISYCLTSLDGTFS